MPYSVIDSPKKYFDTVTYTGNGASPRSIGNLSFKPDFVWSKSRSTAENHNLYDAVRGGTQGLRSNLTNAETSSNIYGYVSTFDSDGVTYISGGTNNDLNNGSGVTFVNWNWLGANTTVSNTSGSITSTVSANTTSGFSIVSYTNPASGSPFTVGHGLGVAPKMIIVKTRNVAQTWGVWHTSIGFGNYLRLDSTAVTASANLVTATSSTTFSTYQNHHATSDTLIAYCFAEVKGFSKFGSYTGNGSTDGTFIYTGFKPAFFIVKTSNASFNWVVEDNKRNTFNVVDKYLLPNSAVAEGTLTLVDFLSNGIKIRTTDNSHNGSGNTHIYMAFAENPFVSSKGIPTTAR
jgi:hypothetical protein